VEYGILVAVVVVGFLVGLSVLGGAAMPYLAHTEPTPNATVLAGLPSHVVAISMSCTPPPVPFYTGQVLNCSLTVRDITTIEPGRLPTGTMAFSSTSGAFGQNSCQLSGPIGGDGVTSGCTFQYRAQKSRRQNIAATYHPTSSHQSRATQLMQVIVAINKTETQLVCANSVPVGEPSQCTVAVLDVFTNSLLPGVRLDTTTSAGGGATGTFSPIGTLSPRSATYTCVTANNGVCGTLFRSGSAGPEEQGPHSIVTTFQGVDQDYEASTKPAVVSVTGPTQHPVKVDVTCSGGVTPQSPLQINLGASTGCTATVSDVNLPDSNGNPTNITPTGTLSWTALADSGGTGGFANSANSPCTLREVVVSVANCGPLTMTYTPTSVGTPPPPDYVGTHQVVARYSSDWIHPQIGNDLQGSTNVYVKDYHAVQVNLTCSAGISRALPLLISGASADTTSCSVTVTDIESMPVTPTGTVAWSLSANGGMGTFSPSAQCQLQPVNNSTAQAQCQAVTYKPTMRGTPDGLDQESTHTLVAMYSGDSLHPLINNDLLGSINVFVGVS
jgi:hypothetical protein